MGDASEKHDLPDDPVLLKALVHEQELRIAVLEEKLRLAAHKRFGASSEKADPDQLGLFNEAETLAAEPETDSAAASAADDAITVPEHTRKKGGRKPLAADLPRVRVEHDIPDAEKMCPCGSGHARPRIGEMVSEQSDIVPARVQVIQHVRFKYGPCCTCDGVFPETAANAPDCVTSGIVTSDTAPSDAATMIDDAATTAAAVVPPMMPPATVAPPAAPVPRAVIVAPLPAQPIPKSIASPGTCAFVATAKYVDGLPLYRLEKILARYGLDVSRGTLAAWMTRLGEVIIPLINLMEEIQRTHPVTAALFGSREAVHSDGVGRWRRQARAYVWT